MKQVLFFSFVFLLSTFAYSQTVIENPKTGMSTVPYLKLEKVELLDSCTMLSFRLKEGSLPSFSIPKKTYIQVVGANEKLYATGTLGVPFGKNCKMPEAGDMEYQIIFPLIDKNVAKLDYGEGNEGGTWFIYDIQLKPKLFQSFLPEKLSGNWFRRDNAQWGISLFDSVAVYKSQVWQYLNYSEKGGVGKIEMKNSTRNLNIYAKSIDDATCLIGETPGVMEKYSSRPDESAIPADMEQYTAPVFNVDTVTYRGYIRNFSPRYPKRTAMVYVNDVLTGEQVSHLVKITDDGTFEAKFTHSNPQGVFVKNPFSFETVFVEPGKTTFQLIDNADETNPVLFMGDCARINHDLLKLKNINGDNNQEMRRIILDFSPEQYKTWYKNLWQKDLDSLESFAQNLSISSKAMQVKKMEVDYRYARHIMDYEMRSISAWREKNKIPRDQRTIDFQPTKPDSSYYDFLTNDLVNNPLAVLTSDYSSFINRLKFMEILRGQRKGLSKSEALEAMEKSGYKYIPEDKPIAERMKEVLNHELSLLLNEFITKYGKQSSDFQKKYSDVLQPFLQGKKATAFGSSEMIDYLSAQKLDLTEDEENYISAMKVLISNPIFKKYIQFLKEDLKMSNKFEDDYRTFLTTYYKERGLTDRIDNLEKVLGIHPGFATDIMASQDYCRPIVSEMTPVSDEKLKVMQAQISTPFIASYIGLMNDAAKAKIEENKKLAVAQIIEIPKNEGDNIFESIMKKYKGKVVYVDFWATWCGPCRSGIERIKPLKEEMKDENVAFVYITNQTSPKGTYDNMIASISGEHYRVSADEWNILSDKFKISGIPHYTLVGKDGNVINPHLGHLENSQLKTMLMKYINE